MIEFVAIVLAIIALVRVSRLERELVALRRASLRDVPVRPLAAPAARTTSASPSTYPAIPRGSSSTRTSAATNSPSRPKSCALHSAL